MKKISAAHTAIGLMKSLSRLSAERGDDGFGGGARRGRVLARDQLPVYGHGRRPGGALLVQSAALNTLVLAREGHLQSMRAERSEMKRKRSRVLNSTMRIQGEGGCEVTPKKCRAECSHTLPRRCTASSSALEKAATLLPATK
jgi:hypothetical protein